MGLWSGTGWKVDGRDITLWLDNELIVPALQAHACGKTVRVEGHGNVVVLQKRGYTEPYERLKP